MMQVDPLAPSRPALKYHGGKWKLAPWIISYLPGHEGYTEVYGGSAAVLLRKSRVWIEVYNDLDGDIVNFFRVLRDREQELVRAIRLTPWSRAEWEQSFEAHPDAVEAARRFYVRAYMSIGSVSGQWNTGWRRFKVRAKGERGGMTPGSFSFMRLEHLYQVADRLRAVQIEQRPALEVLASYDHENTVHYVDPPYPASTRGRWKDKAYAHEMSDEDHRELSDLLHSIEGMVVISGYRCELYDELYEGWQRVDREAQTNGNGRATESLWLNPAVVARRRHTDLPLFN